MLIVKRLKKKNNETGFTLAETLMAVLILLLVSSVIAAGIPAAANAYTKAIDAANAHALLSTTVNALRSELCNAWSVKLSDNDSVIYYKSSTGARTKLYLGTDPDDNKSTIMVQDYLRYDSDSEAQKPSEERTRHALVSDKAKTANLNVVYESISLSLDKDILTFNNVEVQKKDKTPVVPAVSISIRLLNKDFEIPDLSLITAGG